ncbi:MAG: hypothetical protein ACK4WD_00745 [Flavobacteriales bacterium]
MKLYFNFNKTQIFALLLCTLLCAGCYGQTTTCENVIKDIETNQTKSIWSYDNLTPETYHCLGQYFANRDIKNNIFLIQSYGLPDYSHPCVVCRFKSYGYGFYYHQDIIEDKITNFIEGYNVISKEYLKNQIGDSTFAHLNDIPKEYFNPSEIIIESLSSANVNKPYTYNVITDSIINVRFNLDSLFKHHSSIPSKIIFKIEEFSDSSNITKLTLNYEQIKEKGFQVQRKLKNRYSFKITFDFSALENEERFCWCGLPNEKFTTFRIPITIVN